MPEFFSHVHPLIVLYLCTVLVAYIVGTIELIDTLIRWRMGLSLDHKPIAVTLWLIFAPVWPVLAAVTVGRNYIEDLLLEKRLRRQSTTRP